MKSRPIGLSWTINLNPGAVEIDATADGMVGVTLRAESGNCLQALLGQDNALALISALAYALSNAALAKSEDAAGAL